MVGQAIFILQIGMVHIQARKKSTKINFLGPEAARWGGGLPHEGVVAEKFVLSLELCLPWVSKRGIWDVPGILPGSKFVKKKFVRIFRSPHRESVETGSEWNSSLSRDIAVIFPLFQRKKENEEKQRKAKDSKGTETKRRNAETKGKSSPTPSGLTWQTFRTCFIISSVSVVGKWRRSPRRKGGCTFYLEVERRGGLRGGEAVVYTGAGRGGVFFFFGAETSTKFRICLDIARCCKISLAVLGCLSWYFHASKVQSKSAWQKRHSLSISVS